MRTFLFQVVTDGFSAEKSSQNCAELKRVQAGDVSYQENSAAALSRARLEVDGMSAEKTHSLAKVGVFFHSDKYEYTLTAFAQLTLSSELFFSTSIYVLSSQVCRHLLLSM